MVFFGSLFGSVHPVWWRCDVVSQTLRWWDLKIFWVFTGVPGFWPTPTCISANQTCSWDLILQTQRTKSLWNTLIVIRAPHSDLWPLWLLSFHVPFFPSRRTLDKFACVPSVYQRPPPNLACSKNFYLGRKHCSVKFPASSVYMYIHTIDQQCLGI